MGHSRWDPDTYAATAAYRASTGTSFSYSAATAAAPVGSRSVHEDLDPQRINSNGEKIRECLDSDAHPLTTPIVVAFDETGSMADAPRVLQTKLGTLYGILERQGYVPDPQILFGAYGDAQNNEVAPLQVAQFEAGLEMDDQLDKIYLEGNGGGNHGETSGLFMYFMANYSRLDSLEKRGEKGFLFLVGDEIPLPRITKAEIKRYIGDDVESDFTVEEVVEQLQKSYDVFFLLVDNMSAKHQGSLKRYSELLGNDHVLVIENLETVSETIALTLAHVSGAIDDLDSGVEDLVSAGFDAASAAKAGKSLARVTGGNSTVAKAAVTGSLPEAKGKSGSVERL